MNALKWLYPGMHIKRWLVLLMLGIVIVSLGFAYVLREAYIYYTFPDFVYYATLQFLPRPLRGALFVAGGAGMIVLALIRLNWSLISAFIPPGHDNNIVDVIYQHRHLRRGPKVVALGGGTGLSTLLRGLKDYTGNLTAIVTVADDGGSSGRLRRELGILPPGDIRNCIAALADVEPLMTKLFQYRFNGGTGLDGHSFGNLFIVAMSGVTGNIESAIRESSRVLAVRGQVLPSTLDNVTLVAMMDDEAVIAGESSITESHKSIRSMYLEPRDAQAYPEAIRAILEADLIILGPGSLFTSVLPNLLVDGIQKAVRSSKAMKMYVCNVATQKGETDGFSVADHVASLERNAGPGLYDYVVVNNNFSALLPEGYASQVVSAEVLPERVKIIMADVVDEDNRLRHDPKKLAHTLMRVYYERAQIRQHVEPDVLPNTATAAEN
ncbi:MAG: YvcK family protein [Chloroflexota bacterium]|nr:MAG: YvcK family protein [Chloroflexota bacterium]